jgi:lipopolysaccharide/colanic/teichoic acid biosynthesis glycosyltransferase
MALIALAIWITMGRPILFRQPRIGYRGRVFTIYKFRTMTEVSLVGPRPLLVEYRDLYTPEQWRRHEMPPGMAGPVLASGRNLLDWEEKFRLDVWYVDHWSLWLDFKILLRTAWKVLKREGVSAEGHVTMPKFEGVGVRANEEGSP